MTIAEQSQTLSFQAEVHQVLSLVINSLYSNREIFLRELLSNASDALDKRRFSSIEKPELGGATLGIELRVEREAGVLELSDTGIGMTRQELVDNLGTVARSGTRQFAQALAQAQKERDSSLNLIGQFGVGFYSAYLVADRVEVISRAAGTDEAWKWVSDGRETFTVEPAERAQAGTTLRLHLKEEHREYAQTWKVRSLVERYSDYIDYPIGLWETRPGNDEDEPGTEELRNLNQASALWRRPVSTVTEEQYAEFYRHLSGDWQEPLAHTHFKMEGSNEFHSLLFVPKSAPFDLFDRDRKSGLRLYVRRVLVMETCDDLLPPWLRFIKGVVDSDDLPLNVSRELLQDSRATRTIRKQVVKKVLDLLESLAKDDSEKYLEFWGQFGRVLKEGAALEAEQRERIANLLRFETTAGSELTSLQEYVARMPEGQQDIYFVLGANRSVADSPHLESLKRRGWEVLLLTDGVDQWLTDSMPEFEGRKLKSAMAADLDLGDEGDAEADKAADGLLGRMKELLNDRVSEVRPSKRLTDTPACLVIPPGGMAAHIERLLKAQNYDMPMPKRILEVNTSHPLIQRLEAIASDEGGAESVERWVQLLYDQALLTEGSPIENPARFAQSVTELMQQVVGVERKGA
jgi:molecular chaperone HtpG